jgi:hypothetical protein
MHFNIIYCLPLFSSFPPPLDITFLKTCYMYMIVLVFVFVVLIFVPLLPLSNELPSLTVINNSHEVQKILWEQLQKEKCTCWGRSGSTSRRNNPRNTRSLAQHLRLVHSMVQYRLVLLSGSFKPCFKDSSCFCFFNLKKYIIYPPNSS